MELRHLRYFIVLGRELSFGRGAERIGISQPALSLQIAALERELGVTLISRNKRKIELTIAGKVLMERGSRIVKESDDTVLAVQDAAREAQQQLRIGITGYTPINFLTWFEGANRTRHLGFSVVPRVMLLQRIVDELSSEKLELGLVRLPLKDESLRYKVILEDPFVVLLSRKHVLAQQAVINLTVLRNETFVDIARERGGYFPYTAMACRDAGFSPRRIQDVDSRQSMLSTIAAGRGVSLYPASLASTTWSDVAMVRLTGISVRCDLAVAWKPSTPFGATAESLLAEYPVQRVQRANIDTE